MIAMIKTVKMISMISAAVLLPAVAFAATEESKASPAWYDKFTVGETPAGGDASINFTSPGEGKDSYAVDIGVAYHLTETERWYVVPTIEYHNNTALKEEQDVILGGIKGSYLVGDVVTTDAVTGQLSSSLAVWTDAELIHKWDEVKDDQSWMPEITFTPLYSAWGLGSSKPVWSDQMRMQLNLSGGLVYEESASGKDGDALRAKVEAGVTLVPQGYINLKFTLSNTYWNELTVSGKFDDGKDDFNLLKIAATYYIINDKDKNDRLGVRLTYQDGADPDKSLKDQSLVTFGFIFAL